MVEVGGKPILYHVMNHYARYGHNDFLLALGYKSEVIKNGDYEYYQIIKDDFIESFLMELRGIRRCRSTLIGEWDPTADCRC